MWLALRLKKKFEIKSQMYLFDWANIDINIQVAIKIRNWVENFQLDQKRYAVSLFYLIHRQGTTVVRELL